MYLPVSTAKLTCQRQVWHSQASTKCNKKYACQSQVWNTITNVFFAHFRSPLRVKKAHTVKIERQIHHYLRPVKHLSIVTVNAHFTRLLWSHSYMNIYLHAFSFQHSSSPFTSVQKKSKKHSFKIFPIYKYLPVSKNTFLKKRILALSSSNMNAILSYPFHDDLTFQF